MLDKFELKVAIDRPVHQLFSYLHPERISPGVRVEVVFGRQKLVGVVKDCIPYDQALPRKFRLKKCLASLMMNLFIVLTF